MLYTSLQAFILFEADTGGGAGGDTGSQTQTGNQPTQNQNQPNQQNQQTPPNQTTQGDKPPVNMSQFYNDAYKDGQTIGIERGKTEALKALSESLGMDLANEEHLAQLKQMVNAKQDDNDPQKKSQKDELAAIQEHIKREKETLKHEREAWHHQMEHQQIRNELRSIATDPDIAAFNPDQLVVLMLNEPDAVFKIKDGKLALTDPDGKPVFVQGDQDAVSPKKFIQMYLEKNPNLKKPDVSTGSGSTQTTTQPVNQTYVDKAKAEVLGATNNVFSSN